MYCLMILLFQIRYLEARKNSLTMALETARQKNLTKTINETEFKLAETEWKLLKMKKSKTQVIIDCCLLTHTSKIVFLCFDINVFIC
jgi:hypothetical protein